MSDPLKDYLNSIAKFPLLTPQQEIQLGRRVARLLELRKLDRPLTKDEQRELKSGERARQRFIQSNLQLVVHVARRYVKRNMQTLEMIDLIQEGNIGLSRAVELFDYSRGYKFSTYAYWWIRQAISRALIASDPIIRLPLNIHELLLKINRASEAFAKTHGKVASLADLANELNLEEKTIADAIKQSYRVISLDQNAKDDGEGSTILELVSDVIDTSVEDNDQIALLYDYCEMYLDKKTRDIIYARNTADRIPWSQLESEHKLKRATMSDIQRRGINRLRMLMSNPLAGTPLGADNYKQ